MSVFSGSEVSCVRSWRFVSFNAAEPALDLGSERVSEKEQWQIWSRKAPCFDWATSGCIIDSFWLAMAHQAHFTQSEPMSYIDQQGSSLGSYPTFPSPYPHFNRPSGHWPWVKTCLVGSIGKYLEVGVVRIRPVGGVFFASILWHLKIFSLSWDWIQSEHGTINIFFLLLTEWSFCLWVANTQATLFQPITPTIRRSSRWIVSFPICTSFSMGA